MRRLAQPAVLKAAFLAACLSALACYPRLSAWHQRAHPVWYLEAMILLGGTLLWGFVFAWHRQYSSRPVWVAPKEIRPWAAATVGGVFAAGALHLWLDPSLRLASPQEYPATHRQWLAATLFHLGFTQLFLIFAPFAWSIRLFKKAAPAILFTTIFGVVLLLLKTRSPGSPLSPSLFACLLVLRAVLGVITIGLYLRGGVLLVWWWAFLIETRHLFQLADHAE